MRLAAAIFDMDGVLLDSNYIWRDLGPNYLRSHGLEPEEGLRRILQPLSMEDTAVYFRTRYHIPRTDDQIVQDLTDIIRDEYTLRAPAKAGADRLLALLKAHGVPMYVATATDRVLAEAALRRNGLLDYFKGILTCAEVGASKTSPKIYEEALARLGCAKEDCVIFEDSLHAVRTASGAGFRVAAVYDSDSAEAQEEIRSLSETWIPSYDEWFQQDGRIE